MSYSLVPRQARRGCLGTRLHVVLLVSSLLAGHETNVADPVGVLIAALRPP